MEEEIHRYVEAIRIASDPSQGHLHQQALEYLSNLHQNANETWRLALTAFTDMTSEGRKYPTSVRFYSLRLLEEFFDNRYVLINDSVIYPRSLEYHTTPCLVPPVF